MDFLMALAVGAGLFFIGAGLVEIGEGLKEMARAYRSRHEEPMWDPDSE